MTIVYRDEIGIVAVELSDGETGETIDFCDGYCYFTDGNAEDHRIPVADVLRIKK